MSKKILYIEDDPDIFEILNIVFVNEGYEVIGFKSVSSIDQISVIHPDLTLLDVRIIGSVANGDEICRQLKSDADSHQIPVILLSAERDLDIMASACGADDFIFKPFGLVELVSKVQSYIKS
ncbi:response regulator [Pedobacter duraquae]|uniref:Response regulator receiver domain-containing protein n=1 Tax=Pedobacter duraquae TaxID=425511 RepID=A0A4V3C321_9SPHI|nr:response regulator [Pedobacter duraquae]TDO20259.1 response regulator receiver domain-containing protein [Pedobacter duraquae]